VKMVDFMFCLFCHIKKIQFWAPCLTECFRWGQTGLQTARVWAFFRKASSVISMHNEDREPLTKWCLPFCVASTSRILRWPNKRNEDCQHFAPIS
jgi:hypothetical protein